MKRRSVLLGAAALLAPPVIHLAWRRQGADERQRLQTALARRFVRPLRRPGDDGWMTPLAAAGVRVLRALPAALALRGDKPAPLWAYQAESGGRRVFNPILIGRPGDMLRLRFENRLPQDSIVHWHGFANDSRNDGGGMHAAAPGGAFDYQWEIRGDAGLNWYHPHPHLHAGEQLWRGMTGLFLVEDHASDALARALGTRFGVTDLPLVLQDRSVLRSGALASTADAAALAHGRTGAEVLVNLTRYPVLSLPRRWVRLRILNASNARVYRLACVQGGRRLECALLGVDGGLLAAPRALSELYLAPAQRVDLALDLRQAAAGEAWLKTLAFDPLHAEQRQAPAPPDAGDPHALHRPPAAPAAAAAAPAGHVHGRRGEGVEEPLLRILVRPHDGDGGRLPARIAVPSPPPACSARRAFTLDAGGGGRWRINGCSGQLAPAFRLASGAREIWDIRNDASGMPHPMHLHGFAFNVLARHNSPAQVRQLALDASGRTAQDLGRPDTVLVWPGETLSAAVDFAMPFAGVQQYMFHCHNLEHQDGGMMLPFEVGTP